MQTIVDLLQEVSARHSASRCLTYRHDGKREEYEYDRNDRLTTVNYGAARTVSYGLDVLGNWLSLDDIERLPQGNRTKGRVSSFNAFNQLNLQPFLFDTNATHFDRGTFGQADAGLAGRVIEFQARLSF